MKVINLIEQLLVVTSNRLMYDVRDGDVGSHHQVRVLLGRHWTLTTGAGGRGHWSLLMHDVRDWDGDIECHHQVRVLLGRHWTLTTGAGGGGALITADAWCKRLRWRCRVSPSGTGPPRKTLNTNYWGGRGGGHWSLMMHDVRDWDGDVESHHQVRVLLGRHWTLTTGAGGGGALITADGWCKRLRWRCRVSPSGTCPPRKTLNTNYWGGRGGGNWSLPMDDVRDWDGDVECHHQVSVLLGRH